MIRYCIEDFIILQHRSRENTTYGVHEWGQKWNIFVSSYATNCKKMVLPNCFFHDLEIIFFYFLFRFTKIYTFW